MAGNEYGECVAFVTITYISMCGTIALVKSLTACNDHICLFDRHR